MTKPVSRSFWSRGLRLNCIEWGPVDAPRLVLVHGGRDQARAWDDIAEAFADRWRILAPDLRGHGDSSWSPDGSYEKLDYLADLHVLIEGQKAAPVVLVGHSLGANIVLRYAGIFPESVHRLIAIEGLMTPPAVERRREAEPIGLRLRQGLEFREALSARRPRPLGSIQEGVQRLRDGNPGLSEALAQRLASNGMRRHQGGWIWKFDPQIASAPQLDMPSSDFAALMGSISCPTLLVYGEDSPASRPSADGRLGWFGLASEMVIPDAAHWPHHDQTEAFIDMLRRTIG